LANGSRIVSLPGTEGTIGGYAAASLILIDEVARVADELLAQCTPNACGIEWKAGRPLDSSAVTVPTPCVKIPRGLPNVCTDMRAFGRDSGFDPTRKWAGNFAVLHNGP
jgi:hypothetical protein